MLRFIFVAACLATGCDGIFDLEPVKLGSDGGGSSDAGTDGSGSTCYGGNDGAFLQVCLEADIATDPWVEVAEIDTSAPADMCDVQVQADGRDLCVIVAPTINITQAITTRGGKPLVLLATGEMSISGSLIASSTFGRRGPGANPLTCVRGNAGVSTSAGGAGGTFATPGGNGGAADNGFGGVAQAVSGSPLTELAGGCPGGNTATTNGGDGGGVIYLIAGSTITLSGALLDASGERGRRGTTELGGGGGGSGGLIVLDAPMIAIAQSIVVANGGGGGGGGGTNEAGTDGMERNLGLTDYAALGGVGGSLGGGAGGAGADLDSNGTTGEAYTEGTTAGGGGGGGGHGHIKLFGTETIDTASVFSPPLQP